MTTDTSDTEALPSDGCFVESGPFRLSMARDTEGQVVVGGHVRREGTWVVSAPPVTALITGLDLRLEHHQVRDGELSFRGRSRTYEGRSVLDDWHGSIAAEAGWARLEITLTISARECCRPELLLWLGAVDTMNERQFDTFRRTRVSGPTVNSQGLAGNDLPAVFFHDPRQQIQTMVYIPSAEFTWSARRFLDYRCDLAVDRETGRYGVGLTSNAAPDTLLPGVQRFVWYVRQQAADVAPTEWEAQQLLMCALGPLLGKSTASPPSWCDLAAGTTRDLLTPGDAQITVHGFPGHPAYVRDTSQVRLEDRRPRGFELMTHADIAPPLALYLQLHPDAAAHDHLDALTNSLPLFYEPDERWIGNFYPRRSGRWVEDLWYFFENGLIKLPWSAAIMGSENLWEIFLDAIAGATELAHNVGYIFPLFADVRSKQPFGAATNYSVGGMYAYGHLLAHAHTGRAEHLEEARAALATLGRLPLDRMWHEPQQLGFAAAAAALLSSQRDDPVMAALAQDFLSAQLRMVYWCERSSCGNSITGMFQACASLLYPAFKENVESILPWPHLLGAGIGDTSLLLRLIDAQRRNNHAFFDAVRDSRPTTERFIPYENLGTVELPGDGHLGKEIYGAGEVLWLYLLLEALGSAVDPEILVCSLDLPNLTTLERFPPASREYMVFNATDSDRSTTLMVPNLTAPYYGVHWDGRAAAEIPTMEGALTTPVRLGPGESRKLRIYPATSATHAGST